MNIQIEFIRGFVIGVDYVDDIEIPEHDRTVELIRISLGIVWINFFYFLCGNFIISINFDVFS